MAKLVFFWLLFLITWWQSPATGVGADAKSEAKARSKTQVNSDIFMSRKILQEKPCPDIGCYLTYQCPKGCYCEEDQHCAYYDIPCPDKVCLKDDKEYEWCPIGCECTDDNECDYTERAI